MSFVVTLQSGESQTYGKAPTRSRGILRAEDPYMGFAIDPAKLQIEVVID
jgi:hypothetical protein